MDTEILKQHQNIFLGATKELIKNNTKTLLEDDLMPLFSTPPLETMDHIKQKLLAIAKTNHLILDTETVDKILINYREKLQLEVSYISSHRIEVLTNLMEKLDYSKVDLTLKKIKTELVKLDKEIKKNCKEKMKLQNENMIIQQLPILIKDKTLVPVIEKELTKYLQTTYVKQQLEMIDMKFMVKDTTLLNGLKEQLERYQFTKENSHLFD